MTVAVDDCGADSTASTDVSAGTAFDSAAWAPSVREYGIFNLLMCRGAMGDAKPKPAEVATLGMVDARLLSSPAPAPASTRRNGETATGQPRGVVVGGGGGIFSSSDEGGDDEDDVSEGEPCEPSESVVWAGRENSWWCVLSTLEEDVVVREGFSLKSTELRRVKPGELLQQAGRCKTFAEGRAKGCVRLPVKPTGWVTADASKAGGPRYLSRSTALRWRVVYSPHGQDSGDVIVRKTDALNSYEVTSVRCGDVVEQAGPSVTRNNGTIVRMPVTGNVRRAEQENGDSPRDAHIQRAKTLGWVTIDATAAGGPVFFKPLNGETENPRRQRRRRPQ